MQSDIKKNYFRKIGNTGWKINCIFITVNQIIKLKKEKIFRTQLNATEEKILENLNKSDIRYLKYGIINWTACYNDNYFIYINNNNNKKPQV